MYPQVSAETTEATARQKRTGGLYTAGLIGSILLLLGALLPDLPARWADNCLYAGSALLILLLASASGFRSGTPRRLSWGPNPFVLLLFAWTMARAISPPDVNQALGEALRLIAGGCAYFLVAYSAPLRRSCSAILCSLIGVGCVISLVNFSRLAERGGIQGDFQFSVFGTHEDAGTLMLLLLPLCLALVLNPHLKEQWRLGAFVPTLILVVSLLVTRCRSAFAGAAVAVVVLALLHVCNTATVKSRSRSRASSSPRSQGRPVFSIYQAVEKVFTSPSLLLLIGVVVFCAIGGTTFSYFMRTTLGMHHKVIDDLGTRLAMWRGAVLMLMEKPLTGWGLGAYAVLEGNWTHLGFDLQTVHRFGTTHDNIAHNYYVQWAADTGTVGLFLHVAAVSAFLVSALQTLRVARSTQTHPIETALLTGIIAAVAGSAADAFASPSYNYQGVSTIWWTLLGAGVGISETVSRSVHRNRSAESSPPPKERPLFAGLVGVAIGTLCATAITVYGSGLHQQGQALPRGTFRIVASKRPNGKRTREYVWTAIYTNARGEEEATMPGTEWRAAAGPLQAAHVQEYRDRDAARVWRSKLVLPVSLPLPSFLQGSESTEPATEPTAKIRVEAQYRDAFGRHYTATSP